MDLIGILCHESTKQIPQYRSQHSSQNNLQISKVLTFNAVKTLKCSFRNSNSSLLALFRPLLEQQRLSIITTITARRRF